MTTIFGNAQLLQARGAELPDEIRAGMIADIATDASANAKLIKTCI